MRHLADEADEGLVMSDKPVFFVIDEDTRNKLFCLFDEVRANGELGAESLYAWYLDTASLIVETIDEIDSLEPESMEE